MGQVCIQAFGCLIIVIRWNEVEPVIRRSGAFMDASLHIAYAPAFFRSSSRASTSLDRVSASTFACICASKARSSALWRRSRSSARAFSASRSR